jgi:hypothetical protein
MKNYQAWVMNRRLCNSVDSSGTTITDDTCKLNIALPNLLNQFTIDGFLIIAIIIQMFISVERQSNIKVVGIDPNSMESIKSEDCARIREPVD